MLLGAPITISFGIILSQLYRYHQLFRITLTINKSVNPISSGVKDVGYVDLTYQLFTKLILIILDDINILKVNG